MEIWNNTKSFFTQNYDKIMIVYNSMFASSIIINAIERNFSEPFDVLGLRFFVVVVIATEIVSLYQKIKNEK